VDKLKSELKHEQSVSAEQIVRMKRIQDSQDFNIKQLKDNLEKESKLKKNMEDM